jgi:hypothetical protein
MSISAKHIRISAEDFERLLLDPALIQVFLGHLYPQENEYYEMLRQQGRTYVIGTKWQALHYLLTGEVAEPGNSQIASPLAKMILGGHPVPFEDYVETVRSLPPEEVKEIARALQHLTSDDVLANFQNYKTASVDIYRSGSPLEWEEWEVDWLANYYSGLQDFYIRAADEDEAVLIWIG